MNSKYVCPLEDNTHEEDFEEIERNYRKVNFSLLHGY